MAGLMTQLRERFEAGETVRVDEYPDKRPVDVQGYISALRSPKYCGTGRRPLNIVRVERGVYRVHRPGDEAQAA